MIFQPGTFQINLSGGTSASPGEADAAEAISLNRLSVNPFLAERPLKFFDIQW